MKITITKPVRIVGICALARELGVDRGTIWKAVHGIREPGLALKAALEEAGLKLPRKWKHPTSEE